MKCLFKHLLVLSLSFMLTGSALSAPLKAVGIAPKNLCQDVLNWIYKDLTAKNLEKSIERTKKKLLAGILTTLKNHKKEKLDNHPQLAELWLSMKRLDPSFETYLKRNKPYQKFVNYNFFDRILGNTNPDDTAIHNFFSTVKQWKNLQKNQPNYFNGLPDNLRLDDWDLATSTIVDQIANLNHSNTGLTQNLKELSQDLKSFAPNAAKEFDGKNKSLIQIASDVKSIQKNIMKSIVDIYTVNFDDYKDFCSRTDFLNLIQNSASDNYCPVEIIPHTPGLSIEKKLNLIATILNSQNLTTISKPNKPVIITPVDSPEVKAMDQLCLVKIDYFKTIKPDGNETFNIRTNDIVDTVVIHHTGDFTGLKTNAESIHRTHVNKWYMIGYNYLISFGGNGATVEAPRIIQGRDPTYNGAHAGGETLPLSPKMINDFYDNKQGYACREDLSSITNRSSKIQTETTCDSAQSEKRKKITSCASYSTSVAGISDSGSVNGNLTSIGIALLGNFDTGHTRQFMGTDLYETKKIHISSVKDQAINKLVSLINALKSEYPNLKKIVPHHYFRPTRCPASVSEIIQEVSKKTGLEFFTSKSQEFNYYKKTKYKHLRKVNGKYTYKTKYRNFINMMKKIRYQELIIITIKKERLLLNLSDSYKEKQVKRAKSKLSDLYQQKESLNLEIEE